MYKYVLSVCTSTSKEYILEKVVFFIGKLSSSLLGESRHNKILSTDNFAVSYY